MPKPAAEYKRDVFLLMCTKWNEYTSYKNVVGTLLAQNLAHAIFENEARREDPAHLGFWGGTSAAVKQAMPILSTTTIKLLKKADIATFEAHVRRLFLADEGQIQIKQGQVNGLMGKARNGELQTALNSAVLLESQYYTAPPPTVQAPGAPAIPPKPSWMIAKTKAKAWLKMGVQGSTDAYDQVMDKYCRNDGAWPLGQDHKILDEIWRKLVTNAPLFRAPTLGSMYPSSPGGAHVLKTFMQAVSREQLPAKGNTRWENWALFVFGATMKSQPFPDGNKRASRAAYAIIMASADIPFRAPNGTLGSQLAGM
jgi:hypothetical protein